MLRRSLSETKEIPITNRGDAGESFDEKANIMEEIMTQTLTEEQIEERAADWSPGVSSTKRREAKKYFQQLGLAMSKKEEGEQIRQYLNSLGQNHFEEMMLLIGEDGLIGHEVAMKYWLDQLAGAPNWMVELVLATDGMILTDFDKRRRM